MLRAAKEIQNLGEFRQSAALLQFSSTFVRYKTASAIAAFVTGAHKAEKDSCKLII